MATRIWYEDCEYTVFTYHFLERNFSPTTSGVGCGVFSSLTQSSAYAHAGTYSARWALSTANPHAVIGLVDAQGYDLCPGHPTHSVNTNNFRLDTYNSQYWLFRWYVRWGIGAEEPQWPAGGEHVKLIYLNYMGNENGAQFYYIFQNSSSSSDTTHNYFESYISDSGGNQISWREGAASSLDERDGLWHKVEVYMDVGTGTSANGTIITKIDGNTVHTHTGVRFHDVGDTVDANPMKFLQGIPGNVSNGQIPGGYIYMDDYEIFTLSSLDDVPADPFIGPIRTLFRP